MELDIIGLVSACSYALDCIEAELVHVTNRHGKGLHTSAYVWQKNLELQERHCRIWQCVRCCTTMH